jgi:hypothetical protein
VRNVKKNIKIPGILNAIPPTIDQPPFVIIGSTGIKNAKRLKIKNKLPNLKSN